MFIDMFIGSLFIRVRLFVSRATEFDVDVMYTIRKEL